MRGVLGISLMAALAVQAGVIIEATAQTALAAGGPVPQGTLDFPLIDAKLEEGAALAQTANWAAAVEVYAPLVNHPDALLRGQARFGLAVAYSQLGREVEALKVLEGTSADDTELVQAVGELRGSLILQLAEKALMAKGSAQNYLNDYDRLLHKPNPQRAQRLRALEEPTRGEVSPMRVGVLLPLSGPLAPVGKDILRGLQLALTTMPPWRGVGVELVPADTATGAQDAFDHVLAQGSKVVVGPLLSKNVQELAGRAQAVDMTLLALSSDAEAAGAGVHVVPPLPAEQARRMAAWAVANGKLTVGALVPNGPYGKNVLEAFRAALTEQGGRMGAVSFFDPQNTDLSASVRQLAGGEAISGTAPFGAVFMPIPATSMPLATSQMAYYDFDRAGVTMLGTGLWQDESLLGPSNRTAKGALFATPARPTDFISHFTAEFGVAPQGMAIQGYDLGHLLLQLAAEHDWSGRDVGLLLNRPEGFYGVGGYFRFQANGLTERGLALTKIGAGQFEVLQPALTLAPLPVPSNLRPSGRKALGGWW